MFFRDWWLNPWLDPWLELRKRDWFSDIHLDNNPDNSSGVGGVNRARFSVEGDPGGARVFLALQGPYKVGD